MIDPEPLESKVGSCDILSRHVLTPSTQRIADGLVVIDTGCQRVAAGRNTIEKISKILPAHLTVKFKEKPFRFRGVGGLDATRFVARIPVCFDQIAGVLMPAVLEKTPDAPLLMSLNIMQHLGATIDLQQMSISFKHICGDRVIRVPLFRNASGQLCMSLFDFSKMSTEQEGLAVRKVVGDECYLFHTTVLGTVEGNSKKVGLHEVTDSNPTDDVQNPIAAAIKPSSKSFVSSADIPIEPTSNHVRHIRHGGCSYQQEGTSRSFVRTSPTERSDSSVATSGVSGSLGRSYEEHSNVDDDSRNAYPQTDELLHDEDQQDGEGRRILGGHAAHGGTGHHEVQTAREDQQRETQTREDGTAKSHDGTHERVNGNHEGREPCCNREESWQEDQSGSKQSRINGQLHDGGVCQEQGQEREEGEEGPDRTRHRSTSQVPMWFDRDRVCVPQGGTQLHAEIPTLSPGEGKTVRLFHVDRGSEEGSIRGDASQSINSASQAQGDSHPGDRVIGSQFRFGDSAKEKEHISMSTRLDGTGKQWPSSETDMQEVWPSHRDQQEDRREGHLLCGDQPIHEELQQKVSGNPFVTIPSGVRKRVLGELKKTICLLEQETYEEHKADSHDLSRNDINSYLQEKMVGEVFSTPYFSKHSVKHGLQPGRAFDLRLGDDLLDKKQRDRCREHLRKNKYGLLLVSPPCELFSMLQFLGVGRSRESLLHDAEFQKRLRQARLLLNFGIEMCEQQQQLGGKYLFEQPWTASSWKEPKVQQLLKQSNSYLVRTDQCMYKQVDAENNPIRKRTGFLTNSKSIAIALDRQCDKTHEHQHCVGSDSKGSRSQKAAHYPVDLVHAVLRAYAREIQWQRGQMDGTAAITVQWIASMPQFRNETPECRPYPCTDLQEDGWIGLLDWKNLACLHQQEWQEQEHQCCFGEKVKIYALEHVDDDDEEFAEVPIGSSHQEVWESMTAQQQKELIEKIRRAHNGLGHPDANRMMRILRAGKASPQTLAAMKHFECSVCESNQRPKPWRRAAPPRELELNDVVGIDSFEVKHHDRRQRCVSMVDWGTRFHMVIPVENHSASETRRAYRQWTQWFGPPRIVKPDLGTEFGDDFAYKCSCEGTEVEPAALESPTQSAITEREGKTFKLMFAKASVEYGPVEDGVELHELIRTVNTMKNNLAHRCGYTPTQRVFGFTPRMPGSILFSGDDENLTDLSVKRLGDAVLLKQEAMRAAAGKAFFSVECSQALKRAILSGPRPQKHFEPGDKVYFWSVGVHSKVGHPHSAARKPAYMFWHGPARVIVTQQPSVIFLAYQGRLVRCSPEQCRFASRDEELSCDDRLSEVCRVRQELQDNKIRGLHDIMGEPGPPKDKDQSVVHRDSPEREEDRSPPKRRYRIWGKDRASRIFNPSKKYRITGKHDADRLIRKRKAVPPESAEELASRIKRSSQEMSLDEAHSEPEWQDDALSYTPTTESENEISWLDDVEDETDKRKEQTLMWMAVGGKDDEEQDRWEVDHEQGLLMRHHVYPRRGLFYPSEIDNLPVPIHAIGKVRNTFCIKDDQEIVEFEDQDWQTSGSHEDTNFTWTGCTVFPIQKGSHETIDSSSDAQLVTEAFYLSLQQECEQLRSHHQQQIGNRQEEMQRKEVNPSKLNLQDQKRYEEASAKEWKTNLDAEAIQPLTLAESRDIRQRYPQRIIKSRMLYTMKSIDNLEEVDPNIILDGSPAEEPCKAKARWVIRGDRDPDMFDVESSSPVICRDGFMVGLQIIASMKWKLHSCDFSQAFMQGDVLARTEPLYSEQPKEGMPNVQPGCLIKILKTVYGLTDAPYRWNQHLDNRLRKEGYRPSILDPCLYFLHVQGKLEGVIMLATDDMITGGTQKHIDIMQRIRQEYKFGKWEYDQCRFCGKDVRQSEDFSIEVSQEYFAQLRCKHLIQIPQGSKDEDLCTEDQVKQLRRANGLLSWLAKETRIDIAGLTAFSMQCFPNPTIRHLKMCNKALKEAYLYKDCKIIIRPIEPSQLSVVVSSDAAWGNARTESDEIQSLHSQAGYVVMIGHQEILAGEKTKMNIISWKSHTLKRKTISTLSAESQALIEASSVAAWFRFLFCEAWHSEQLWQNADWTMAIRAIPYTLITDAKSVYDALAKPTNVASVVNDKRTAIDLALLRDEFKYRHAGIRWIDTHYQLADSLTKIMHPWLLRSVLKNGDYQIRDELDTMKMRQEMREQHKDRCSGNTK